MRRPKGTKTRKAVSKRFRITGTGKVKFHGAGKRHLMKRKSAKRSRKMSKAKILGATDLYRILQNLPFSH
jgi:large subunit ribosomal protein L35